ncbi:hypothetical protein [Aminivibrio sp.]|jgi:hypothetical protein|uniref:hypothetical protein n=1 Tax=Aminivibrio sp. TaxID=1872489 RepID=UPI001A50F913|nr:hypothetical protein [Aminivibrio sp.]MBL3539267.1 hypothetical protein [Aminivibrio sp.]MDK2958268.1 hypothetical protein [Synergistaceae bacterium]
MTGGRDLESFKEALEREHLEKVRLLEMARDEEIADLIAARRLSVQKKVAALRKEQEDRFRLLAEETRKNASASATAFFLEAFSNLTASFGEELRKMAETLRISDRERYGRALSRLAEEALECFGRPAVLLVEKGEGELLRKTAENGGLFDGVEIREANLNGWGGCLAETENEILDNTLLTRWGRMSACFSLSLSRLMHDSFIEIHRRISQL